MFNFFKKSDSDIKQDVSNELMWDPSINPDKVEVTSKNGIVTLHGSVPHFMEKMSAVHAAQGVGGVKAVADELEVKSSGEKTDEEIAQAALSALKWNYAVPSGINVSVADGWVTITGKVDWDYQRTAARDAVAHLMGVTAVTNDITLKAKKLDSNEVRNNIQEALKRSAATEERNITVVVDNGKVTLSGKLNSNNEIETARIAAWNAAGVADVVNNLTISM